MEKNYKKLCPFKGWTLENFPFIEADFDAITNYELLCKIVEYLNKTSSQFNDMIDNINYLNNWFNNLDVQDEINNKLDEMVEEGTLQEIISNYLETTSIINVKQKGAKGDGTTDDTLAIQTVIDENPNCSIYFPDGTYLISSKLSLSSTDNKKVYLILEKNATIKASNNFIDDFMIIFGDTGFAETYGDSTFKTGIDGGIIDCNNVTSGILVKNIHLAKIQNISIINSILIGLEIDKSNNNSSDAYINNVDLRGTDANTLNTIGLFLKGADNNINMLRTSGFHIGIKLNGSGNFLTDCHPLYSRQTEATNYNTSIGFEINSQNNTFNGCYSDNFSIGFQIDDQFYFKATNLFVLFYDNDSNHNHIVIKSLYYRFLGKINGLTFSFPENGTNRGLYIADSNHDTYVYPDYYYLLNNDANSGSIQNINIPKGEWQKLTYQLSDPILLSNLQNINTLTLRGKDDRLEADKWYPVMLFSNDIISSTLNSQLYDINFKIGKNFDIDMLFEVQNDTLLTKSLKTNINTNGLNITFALGYINDIKKIYILYFKINSFGNVQYLNDNVYSTTINNNSFGTSMIILPRTSTYNNFELNGINSISNLLTTGKTINNINVENGVFEKFDWADTHNLPGRDPIANQNSCYIIFVHWSNSTAVYALYYSKIMPLNVENITGNDTINITYTDYIYHITASTSSVMYACKF